MEKWKDVEEEFLEHVDNCVQSGKASSLSGLERCIIDWVFWWLSEHYHVETKT